MSTIFVGTNGWQYDSWAGGAFYPPGLPRARWRDHYLGQFPTVEINATFYRTPNEMTVRTWGAVAPRGFQYAYKASRYVTHIKRLIDVAEPVQQVIARARSLGRSLGPILWQLPPSVERDLPRLERFLELLPDQQRHAVEFRHHSWFNQTDVQRLLAEKQVALVWLSSRRMPQDLAFTAPFAYVRFHGLEQGYRHAYTDEELAPWAERLAATTAEGSDVYAYFNNDGNANAPRDARRLLDSINERTRKDGAA